MKTVGTTPVYTDLSVMLYTVHRPLCQSYTGIYIDLQAMVFAHTQLPPERVSALKATSDTSGTLSHSIMTRKKTRVVYLFRCRDGEKYGIGRVNIFHIVYTYKTLAGGML